MLHFSQGFHTSMIRKRLTVGQAEGLLGEFRNSGLRVRPDRGRSKADPFGHHWIIEYPGQTKGISWYMRITPEKTTPVFSSDGEDRPCNVKAIINPKVFVGIKYYITAASSDYLGRVEALFDMEAGRISPALGRFAEYSLIRNDYCLNADVSGPEFHCSPEQLMTLLKRADIPPHFREWTEFDTTTRRDEVGKDSFYLKSKSVVVNYYLKYPQLLREYEEHPDLEEYRNVIRLEVQFRYQKMYSLSRIIKAGSDLPDSAVMKAMLSDDFCAKVIRDYFYRVVGRGDYYTLDIARQMVKARRFRPQKEERLISTLEFVNRCRGIHKAKSTLEDVSLEGFRHSLRELDAVRINAVTLPREWGIKHIPNPLREYYGGLAEERMLFSDDRLR